MERYNGILFSHVKLTHHQRMSSGHSKAKVQQPRIYKRDECVVFHMTKDTFGGLSNMAGGFPLNVNGVAIKTSEALYQACRFPMHPTVQQLIFSEASPMTAKRKTSPYKHLTRSDWDDVRHKIMRWSLRVKLAQNYSKFGELLLATGDKHIIEQSSRDDYWGAFTQSGGVLVGQNVLGRLLMELRSRLQVDASQDLRVVDPLPLENFLILGRQIETVDSKTIELSDTQPRLC